MSQPTSIEPLDNTPEATLPSAQPSPAKPKMINIYTMMLIISLLSLSAGCILLYLEYQRFQ